MEAIHDQLRDYLGSVSEMMGGLCRPKGWKYKSMEEFVLKNGKPHTCLPAPSWLKKGEAKMCFMNAYREVEKSKELVYVEGYALNIIPVMHAWVSPVGSSIAYDVTWKDPQTGYGRYYGIPMKLDYVRQVIGQRERYGVIDAWEIDFPLLSGAHTERDYALTDQV